MSAIIHVDGVELDVSDDREPRMLDADLAKRLGYKAPRQIRELIKSLVADGEIAAPNERRHQRRSLMPKGGEVYREVTEYLLDEDQVISICMAAKVDRARELGAGES